MTEEASQQRQRAFGGTEEDFPTYILKVLGKDRSWMEDAACRNHELARKCAWTCKSSDTFVLSIEPILQLMDGKELIEAALSICYACPAQYHCALWAIEVREESGTWSMRHEDLLWLCRQGNPEAVVHQAKLDGEPVQVAVGRAHGEYRKAVRRRRDQPSKV